jgi:serine/threonine protein kinase
MTLLAEGGFGCVYYPGFSCEGKVSNETGYVTKIQKKNFNAQNEIQIGNILKQISDYSSFFVPVISNCPLELKELTSNSFSKCKIIKPSSQIPYTLMKLPYVKSEDFFDSISKQSKSSLFMNSFSHLCKSLELLKRNEVCHFDLKNENILFDPTLKIPLIIDFGISIYYPQIIDNLKNYFYTYSPSYYIWPLEVHVINFLINNEVSSLTGDDIQSIIESSVDANKGFENLSETFINDYKAKCFHFFNNFKDVPKEQVIAFFISKESFFTWDIYSLSIMYLRFLPHLFGNNYEENNGLRSFKEILFSNILPNFKERNGVEKTLSLFEKLILSDSSLEK